MARQPGLKCKVCGRTFKLPLHLGRHMSASHGAPSAKKAAPGRRVAPRMARSSTANGNLLERVRAMRGELVSQQSQLAAQVTALDRLIAALTR